jgi:hypothetical protein
MTSTPPAPPARDTRSDLEGLKERPLAHWIYGVAAWQGFARQEFQRACFAAPLTVAIVSGLFLGMGLAGAILRGIVGKPDAATIAVAAAALGCPAALLVAGVGLIGAWRLYRRRLAASGECYLGDCAFNLAGQYVQWSHQNVRLVAADWAGQTRDCLSVTTERPANKGPVRETYRIPVPADRRGEAEVVLAQWQRQVKDA